MTPDEFLDRFYYRAIRTKIGEALRGQSLPTETPPERLLDLIQELDQLGVDDPSGTKEKPEQPEHKREYLR